MRFFLISIGSAMALAGCTTTSFAPPNVNFQKAVDYSDAGHHCGPKTVGTDLEHNVDGARRLIDNFIISYRCAAHSAADGRQFFEVPSFLATTLGAAAGAIGAGTHVAIGTTVTSGILNGGKSYYSPQQKADMYDSALDALLCIKTEAVAIDALTIAKVSAVQEQKGAQLATLKANLGVVAEPEVMVSASKQYFDLVAASLLSVERVLSQRLSAAGAAFDPEGVIAQIKNLTKEEEEAKTDADGSATDAANATAEDAANAAAVTEAAAAAATDPQQKAQLTAIGQSQRMSAAQTAKVRDTIIKLNTLKPKLEQCVVRAKV